jgi:hypothetical protein
MMAPYLRFIACLAHWPLALHAAGLGQPGQGLNAAFLPEDFAGAFAIIIFPYAMVGS